MKSVCVYCASSNHTPDVYLNAASRLGEILADEGFTVVYGGGKSGSMGRVADAALARGGEVIGFIPEFMREVEWDHPGLTKLHVTGTMAERKAGMLMTSDALVTLPGGCGTMEEFFEALTLKRLGKFSGPIVVVNINGFYDAFGEFMSTMIGERFMNPKHREMWTVVDTVEEVVPAIQNAAEWPADAIRFAAVRRDG